MAERTLSCNNNFTVKVNVRTKSVMNAPQAYTERLDIIYRFIFRYLQENGINGCVFFTLFQLRYFRARDDDYII